MKCKKDSSLPISEVKLKACSELIVDLLCLILLFVYTVPDCGYPIDLGSIQAVVWALVFVASKSVRLSASEKRMLAEHNPGLLKSLNLTRWVTRNCFVVAHCLSRCDILHIMLSWIS